MKKLVVLLCAILALTLSACGFTEDVLAAEREVGYQEGYKAGYDAGYDAGYAALRPVSKPESGTILSGSEYEGSTITVTADSSSDYVVSLKNSSGKEYISVYIHAGDTVTIGVPEDYIYVYFACGTEWYGFGKGLMFGEGTSYSKDDEALDCYEYAWEYTLYPVNNGNFSETPSNENEFF